MGYEKVYPNFLIIGAPKAGTTALACYLSKHPEIFIPEIKEPQYFTLMGRDAPFNGPLDDKCINQRGIRDIESYKNLFVGSNGVRAAGEASTTYMYTEGVEQRIFDFNPNMKLIALLRDPVDRAYSDFLFARRDGNEPLEEIEQALEEEKQGKRSDWWNGRYITAGLYGSHIARYLSLFNQSQLKIIFYDDLRAAPQDTVKEILQFLEVNDELQIDANARYNVSGIPKRQWLNLIYLNLVKPNRLKDILIKSWLPQRVRRRIRGPLLDCLRNMNLKSSKLDEDAKQRIYQQLFAEDILRLEQLLNVDLSRWKHV